MWALKSLTDMRIFERGDIIICDLCPATGHEQAGKRPALVLSSREFNITSNTAIICPITTRIRGMYFEVPVMAKKTKGVVLPHHIRSIDIKARRVRFVDKASEETIRETVEKIHILIGHSL